LRCAARQRTRAIAELARALSLDLTCGTRRIEQSLIATAKDGIAGKTKAAQSRAANSTSYP
jgi:hypothetical protein